MPIRHTDMKRKRPQLAKNCVHSGALVLFLLMAGGKPASAYADPGSGALLWQFLVAGFVGGMFYFRKITRWLRFRQNRKDDVN